MLYGKTLISYIYTYLFIYLFVTKHVLKWCFCWGTVSLEISTLHYYFHVYVQINMHFK